VATSSRLYVFDAWQARHALHLITITRGQAGIEQPCGLLQGEWKYLTLYSRQYHYDSTR